MRQPGLFDAEPRYVELGAESDPLSPATLANIFAEIER